MHLVEKRVVENKSFKLIKVNQKDIEVTFLNYGATIYSVKVKDFNDKMENVLLKYQDLASYIDNDRYLNATIGPISGRIKDGKFVLNKETIQLDKNFIGKHNLHGGKDTLARRIFNYEIEEKKDKTIVTFTYLSLEQNKSFPGNQTFKIVYTVKQAEIQIDFFASTDKTTVINLTNHAYFNLTGDLKNNIVNHLVKIKAKTKMKVDDELIPTGKELVTNTKYDFTILKKIETGIDDLFFFDKVDYNESQVTLIDPLSKRQLDVFTTYPCVVCYTDNYPMKEELGYSAPNEPHMGICFETQNPTNGINMKGMESSILSKDELYHHTTRFVFSLEK